MKNNRDPMMEPCGTSYFNSLDFRSLIIDGNLLSSVTEHLMNQSKAI